MTFSYTRRRHERTARQITVAYQVRAVGSGDDVGGGLSRPGRLVDPCHSALAEPQHPSVGSAHREQMLIR
jgi:hypothetical protein